MWVTNKWDPYNWHEVPKEQLGCDAPAKARFNLLNQCTNKGPYAANYVLTAMLKKKQDAFNPFAKPLGNPNAYLMATCNN